MWQPSPSSKTQDSTTTTTTTNSPPWFPPPPSPLPRQSKPHHVFPTLPAHVSHQHLAPNPKEPPCLAPPLLTDPPSLSLRHLAYPLGRRAMRQPLPPWPEEERWRRRRSVAAVWRGVLWLRMWRGRGGRSWVIAKVFRRSVTACWIRLWVWWWVWSSQWWRWSSWSWS